MAITPWGQSAGLFSFSVNSVMSYFLCLHIHECFLSALKQKKASWDMLGDVSLYMSTYLVKRNLCSGHKTFFSVIKEAPALKKDGENVFMCVCLQPAICINERRDADAELKDST